jgi:flagellin
MRIDGGTGIQFQLQKTTKGLSETLQSLASGKSINSAKDDPAGLALINALAASSSGLSIANDNISLSQSALQVADSALSETSDGLQRLRDLAVQSSNGALSSDDRANLQQEYDQILGQIDDTARETNFNGTNLLDGSFNQEIQTGSEKGQSTNVNIGSASANALGISSSDISTQSSAQDALDSIDAAIERVNSLRADIGAKQNALDFTSEANAVQNENLQAAKSEKGDADFANLQSTLVQQQIQQQTQVQALNAQFAVQKSLLKIIG